MRSSARGRRRWVRSRWPEAGRDGTGAGAWDDRACRPADRPAVSAGSDRRDRGRPWRSAGCASRLRRHAHGHRRPPRGHRLRRVGAAGRRDRELAQPRRRLASREFSTRSTTPAATASTSPAPTGRTARPGGRRRARRAQAVPGAGGGGRTRTERELQGILSPQRLPVPPPRRRRRPRVYWRSCIVKCAPLCPIVPESAPKQYILRQPLGSITPAARLGRPVRPAAPRLVGDRSR
jgi:hypothetical protein